MNTSSTAVSFLLLAASLAFCSVAAATPKGIMPVDATPAPALRLENLDGEPYDLAEHRGQWVFVHFWASWCGPCRREMPSIARLMQDIQGSGLEFVLVNTAETEDDAFTFLGAVAPDITPLMDLDGQVTAVWQPRGLPATFLVDPQGRIRYQALGGRAWEQPDYVEFLRSLK